MTSLTLIAGGLLAALGAAVLLICLLGWIAEGHAARKGVDLGSPPVWLIATGTILAAIGIALIFG